MMRLKHSSKGSTGPSPLRHGYTHMETLCHAFDNWVLDRVLS